MINGTGPGRGTPWWRWRRVLTLWRGLSGLSGAEPTRGQREGRLVARIGR